MGFLARAQKEVRSFGVDAMMELQDIQAKCGRHAAAACVGLNLAAAGVTIVPAFADEASGGDIASFGTSVGKIIGEIYNAAFPVVTVLAALMLVIAFIMRMTGSQQSAAKATSWIVRIIVCYVAINCIGLILKVIYNTAVNNKLGFVDTSYGIDAPAAK